MKLYSTPGSCSLTSHIVASEAGLKIDFIKVDLKTHTFDNGKNYYEINPLGYVPFLVLDNGIAIHESTAINQYLADLAPNSGLLAPVGDIRRYKTLEQLNFVATELHKGGFSPLFRPDTPKEYLTVALKNLHRGLKYVNDYPELIEDSFSISDAYLFTVARWLSVLNIDISEYKNLQKFLSSTEKRPAVQSALRKEGLTSAMFTMYDFAQI